MKVKVMIAQKAESCQLHWKVKIKGRVAVVKVKVMIKGGVADVKVMIPQKAESSCI